MSVTLTQMTRVCEMALQWCIICDIW